MSRRSIEIEKLRQENQQIKSTVKEELLNNFDEEERKEYENKPLEDIQLALDIKNKYKPKGIRRSEFSRGTRLTSKDGSIGKYDYQTRTWR